MSESKMERYEVEGYEVTFVPWHSEFTGEDFTAVSIRKDGVELIHAGRTKHAPSEPMARGLLRAMLNMGVVDDDR